MKKFQKPEEKALRQEKTDNIQKLKIHNGLEILNSNTRS